MDIVELYGTAINTNGLPVEIRRENRNNESKLSSVTVNNIEQNWKDVIIYPSTTARIIRMKSDDLETIEVPSNIRLVGINSTSLRDIRLHMGVEAVVLRKCSSLEHIYLPPTVKVACLHPKTFVVNMDEVTHNNCKVIYASDEIELENDDMLRPITDEIFNTLIDEIDEREKS